MTNKQIANKWNIIKHLTRSIKNLGILESWNFDRYRLYEIVSSNKGIE